MRTVPYRAIYQEEQYGGGREHGEAARNLGGQRQVLVGNAGESGEDRAIGK
ncbi:hypothetical protein [Streptomyces sp. NPDC059010]|uniref:hypothetical protein n=1 Tax=Streptomyces sp. NPDC059010 TaxID=3346695 RepID=UPI00367C049D